MKHKFLLSRIKDGQINYYIRKCLNWKVSLSSKSNFSEDVDTNKIFFYKKVCSNIENYKYFIGYKDEDKIKQLYIILPKMTERAKALG